jgi:hypothetical protein
MKLKRKGKKGKECNHYITLGQDLKSHQQTLLLFPSGFRENQLLKASFAIF